MTIRDFYLLALVLSSALGSFALFSFYVTVKPEAENPKKRGVLFIELASIKFVKFLRVLNQGLRNWRKNSTEEFVNV